MDKRTMIVVGSVIAALLAAVLVALFLVLGQLQRQSEQDAYEDCLARYGFAADEAAPSMNDDEAAAYLDEMVAAAEACSN